jgi:arylsulfatase A-like enzyme
MNAIVMVIDRLHVGYLGAYGNTWVRSPAIDRLAAEGFVFDQAFIESPDLERFYAACWLGRHAMGPPQSGDAASSLPALLATRSIPAILLTDDHRVAEAGQAASFHEVVTLDLPDCDRSAETVDQTRLARCFAGAIEFLESARGPYLLWCHFRGFSASWDAPRPFRIAYHDEGDPDPPEWTFIPNNILPEDYDPDELLGFSQAYAGQVSVLDACVEVLREALHGLPAGQGTMLLLTSARGFPLGEHRRVGVCDETLYSELVHVPLLAWFNDRIGAAERSQAMVQTSDFCRTVLDWFDIPSDSATNSQSLLPLVRGDVETVRDRVVIRGRGRERAILTPAWYLRAAAPPELYLRPDDRWEANDIADRCPEVVEGLLDVLSQDEQSIQNDQIPNSRPLDPLLRSGLE